MAFNINTFTAALKAGGARNALFQVQITNPVNGVADIQVPFMVKAAPIPAATIGVVEVPYFGRMVKVAGNRTFDTWAVTVINDEDFAVRNAMEEWSNAINSFNGNLRELGGASPLLYRSNAEITQYSKTGVPLRIYRMVNIWPTEISTIELAWETEGIEEFTVTFAYDYWEISGGITGNAGT